MFHCIRLAVFAFFCGALSVYSANIGGLNYTPCPSNVYRDSLVKCYAVDRSPLAQTVCYLNNNTGQIIFGNGFLEVVVNKSPFKLVSITNKLLNQTNSLSGNDAKLFTVDIYRGTLPLSVPVSNLTKSSDSFSVDSIVLIKENGDTINFCAYLPDQDGFRASVDFEICRFLHAFRYRLEIRNLLEDTAAILTYTMPRYQFLSGGGFFSLIEFPMKVPSYTYETNVYYDPGKVLEQDSVFLSETSVMGVVGPSQYLSGGTDIRRTEWLSEYYNRIAPKTDAYPFIGLQSYTAGELTPAYLCCTPKSLMDTTLTKMAAVGCRQWLPFITYEQYKANSYGTMTAGYDYADSLAQRLGMFPGGFWTPWTDDYWEKPGYDSCHLSAGADAVFNELINRGESSKWSIWYVDFFPLSQCNNPLHHHLPGKYSRYPQMNKFLQFLEKCKVADYTNIDVEIGLGPIPLMAKYANNLHSNLDFLTPSGIDLHPANRTGDGWAGYWDLAKVKTIPSSRIYPGLVGLSSNSGTRHDFIGWRYNLLNALAMNASIYFQKIRLMPGSEIGFTRSWVDWAKRNKEYLYECRRLFLTKYASDYVDNVSGLRGYTHIIGDRGFFAITNKYYVSHTAKLTLLNVIPGAGQAYIKEIYPLNQYLNNGNAFNASDTLTIEVPPKTVLYYCIGPRDFVDTHEPGMSSGVIAKENYITEWTGTAANDTAVVSATFNMPPGLKEYLQSKPAVTDTGWKHEPFAYKKAYLQILLSGDSVWTTPGIGLSDPDISVNVNGSAMEVQHSLCSYNSVLSAYFVDVDQGLVDSGNTVIVRVPQPSRFKNFSGAWLDWMNMPDSPYTSNNVNDPRELDAAMLFAAPNPFNPVVNIRYTLPRPAETTVQVFNVNGKLLRTLIRGKQEAGSCTIRWDGTDANRRLLSSGIYILKLKSGTHEATHKIIMMK